MKTNVLHSFIRLALAPFALAQQDFSKVEVKAIHVAENIYMLTGSGGNIGVSVGPDGILIVDDQFAPLAEKIEAALRQLNPGKLKFVLAWISTEPNSPNTEAMGGRQRAV